MPLGWTINICRLAGKKRYQTIGNIPIVTGVGPQIDETQARHDGGVIGRTDTTKPIANATVTADSALLQKSAEQVTRKLINQLTTMSKYNLKQMIDNPAGKYETALNKHAQNKLRAEVRKQLKNFNLADAVRAKDSSFGSDVMAPDEAIDADKIPAELLEQIGQALDFDFYDLSGSEPRDSTEGNADCLIVDSPNDQPVGSDKPPTGATRNEGASVAQQVQRQIIENVNNSAENLVHNAYSPSEQVVLNEGNQLVPEHADRLAIDNVPVNQPHQGMPEMIVPDLMSPPRPPLVMLLDQMQSIDSQTMELFKRKMEIDANIMKLNGERMEIDQEIVKLQNARDEQMNSLRFALFLPFPADGVQNNCSPLSISLNPGDDRPQDAPTGGTDVGNQVEEKDVVSSTLGSDAQQNTQQQTGCNQERTIRRITKISGNSELMRIFQRRRLLSERSSDDNPTIEDGSTPNDQPRS
uniref:Uncharacterized protein n=1 Tax=Anopheles atroparvus TaxID=41427 RepID=A0A182JDA0_ANOAO